MSGVMSDREAALHDAIAEPPGDVSSKAGALRLRARVLAWYERKRIKPPLIEIVAVWPPLGGDVVYCLRSRVSFDFGV